MRSAVQFARLILLVSLAAVFAGAQDNDNSERQARGVAHPGARQVSTAPKAAEIRTLTLGDGLAILNAALDSRHRIVTRRDCSHFVHDLYEQAGFSYQYASSTDLYVGVDEFRQVSNPQPGDLAVWRGHVGIVVNPQQHSFFSLLRSGPGVDLYDSPYWRQRGRPRFFRFVKEAPSNTSSSLRNANWKPARSSSSESEDELISEESESSGEIGKSEIEKSKKPPESPPADLTLGALIVSSSRPDPDQITAAFLQACKGWDQSMRGRDLFKMSQAVIVFDHFAVKKVHIGKHEGWVEVEIGEPISLAGSDAHPRKRTEHQRWALSRRDNRSWELTPAPNTIYVNQPTAVRLLANELAQIADSNDVDRTPQKAQLARLLDALLEK
jgi:hypothetical protein